jgi:hypothetical protein
MGMGRDEDWDEGVSYGACMQVDDPEQYWEMQGGSRIRIKDMTDSHLRNTLRMLHRKGINPPQLAALLGEAKRRSLEWR